MGAASKSAAAAARAVVAAEGRAQVLAQTEG